MNTGLLGNSNLFQYIWPEVFGLALTLSNFHTVFTIFVAQEQEEKCILGVFLELYCCSTGIIDAIIMKIMQIRPHSSVQ